MTKKDKQEALEVLNELSVMFQYCGLIHQLQSCGYLREKLVNTYYRGLEIIMCAIEQEDLCFG